MPCKITDRIIVDYQKWSDGVSVTIQKITPSEASIDQVEYLGPENRKSLASDHDADTETLFHASMRYRTILALVLAVTVIPVIDWFV